jgi:hypothetical protein
MNLHIRTFSAKLSVYLFFRYHRSSVKRLAAPVPRGVVTAGGGGVGTCAPRYTTGVPPLSPVSNLCPLRTVNPPASLMNGPPGLSTDARDAGLVRRRLAARRRIPTAASNATPPSVPTRAGTRGTTTELPVDVAVGELVPEELGPGRPVSVGVTQVNPLFVVVVRVV